VKTLISVTGVRPLDIVGIDLSSNDWPTFTHGFRK